MKKKLRNWLYRSAIGYSIYNFVKHLYYAFWILLTSFNYYLVKCRDQITHCYENRKLHLGCGRIYLEGWINIDNYIGKQRRKNLWLDITNGLPFREYEIAAIFTSHTLEHFVFDDVMRILRECYRVLKPNGYIRIAVPSLTLALNAYYEGRLDHFKAKGKTISGRFIDEILWHGTHHIMFNFDYLRELLEEVGFRKIKQEKYRESNYLNLSELIKMDKYEGVTLFVECIK